MDLYVCAGHIFLISAGYRFTFVPVNQKTARSAVSSSKRAPASLHRLSDLRFLCNFIHGFIAKKHILILRSMSSDASLSSNKGNKISNISSASLKCMGFILIGTVWISAGLFGLYILAFYFSPIYAGDMQQWNKGLPGLYVKGSVANPGIGIHFAAGGMILILGSVQLIDRLRVNYLTLHRWIGRVYIICCVIAALGGLIFIGVNGTIGGRFMNIGFSLYGMLMLISALQTYRYAVRGNLDKHRAWALRLYALAIGSWLYRIEYGFWFMLANGAGHNDSFNGLFDKIMPFFFYLPNLLVAQIFIVGRKNKLTSLATVLSVFGLMIVTGFLLLGTYYFARYYWGPAITKWILA